MHAAPRFSVVIPAFNAERTVRGTVRSVLAQNEKDLELIVVDDGSTDATADLIRSVPDSRVRLITQHNAGLPAARNAGIRAARGRLIGFLDADDLWLPTYLQRMGTALGVRPDAGMAYSDAWVFQDGTGRIRRQTVFDRRRPRGQLPPDPGEFFLVHLRDNFFFSGGTTVRAAVFDHLGGFREDMTSLEDYEMWLRIEASRYAAVEISEPLALYRASAHQMSTNIPRMIENLLKLCEILEARDDLPPAAYRLLVERRRDALRTSAAITRPASLSAIRARTRTHVSRVWHRLPGRSIWCDRPPAVVAAELPNLALM